MSLIRPRWLEDVLKLTPSTSTRLRGLKSFEPHHVPAFQDVLYADDPIFWQLTGSVGGVALNNGKVGVQTPADDNIVCQVDGVLIDAVVADAFTVDVVLGGQLVLAVTTDSSVTKRNRREQSRTTGVERTGLFRIVDNTNAFAGTSIAEVRIPVGVSLLVPISFRLFGAEQLFVRAVTANQACEATMWGRLTTKGQR